MLWSKKDARSLQFVTTSLKDLNAALPEKESLEVMELLTCLKERLVRNGANNANDDILGYSFVWFFKVPPPTDDENDDEDHTFDEDDDNEDDSDDDDSDDSNDGK
ncbi:hypothetical protein RFI_35154, partial [Reticulomyxa filosa]